MNKKKARKFLLEHPELYEMIYGPAPKKEKKTKKHFPKKDDIKKIFMYLIEPINTVLNTINYNRKVKKADRLYKKTHIHRHVMPLKPKKLGIIVGADLVAYNKKALKYNMKRFKYNTLKKEAYYSTDTLSIKKKRKNELILVPIINN